jgi:quinol monooxygenase YgiN
MTMLLTVLEGIIAPERAPDLEAAFERAGQPRPEGLLRSELLRGVTAPDTWRIQTLWADRQALERMRAQGTPAGVLMFRAAGVELS